MLGVDDWDLSVAGQENVKVELFTPWISRNDNIVVWTIAISILLQWCVNIYIPTTISAHPFCLTVPADQSPNHFASGYVSETAVEVAPWSCLYPNVLHHFRSMWCIRCGMERVCCLNHTKSLCSDWRSLSRADVHLIAGRIGPRLVFCSRHPLILSGPQPRSNHLSLTWSRMREWSWTIWVQHAGRIWEWLEDSWRWYQW